MATLEQLRLNLRRGGIPRTPLQSTPSPVQGTPNPGIPKPGQTPLDILNRYKAAQASIPPAQGSPGFTGPPRPAVPVTPTSSAQSVLGRAGNVIRGTAGAVGRGIALAAAPAAVGTVLAAIPRTVGAGTLDSPEAQQALAENEKVRLARGDNLVGELGNYPGLKSSNNISGFVNNPPGSTESYNKTYIPSEAEEAARRLRMPVSAVARPEGIANIQRDTGANGGAVFRNARTNQIRVGAATDEEAARNLQSRAEQDAATQNTVAGIDRSTEALRDLRAERMGIPRSQLDIREGRAVDNSPTLPTRPSDEELNRDRDKFISQFAPSSGGFGRGKRQAQANMINAYQAWTEDQRSRQKPTTQASDPLDAQRYLLDRSKFNWQQGVDKGRLTIDSTKAQSDLSTAELQQKKYNDESRKSFMDTFTYPDENAPREQLGSLVYSLSTATGSQIPPEIMTGYVKAAADEAGVDWEDAPPKSLTALGKRAMELAAKDYR